jgi:ComF family protein
VAYDDTSRALIGQFKYGDQLHLLPFFTSWLVRVAGELISEVDVIIPVPLHRWRLWVRGYNQAAEIAKDLGAVYHLPVDFLSLKRPFKTRPQVGLKREERLKNVRQAFAVQGDVVGKVVLLVDDVYTTGATLTACSQTLLNAGAKEVRVLTLARVLEKIQLMFLKL